MTDVFISYARADRNRVRIIALGLTAEGFSVWWDPEIKPGSKWNDAIRKSLEGAAAVVTCWSPTSIKSRWVVAETTHASNENKLVPCVVKGCQPPIPFNMIQSADLSNWNGDADDADWVLLLRQIRRLVEAKRRAAAAIPPPSDAEGATGPGSGGAPSPVVSTSAPGPAPRYTASRTRGRLGPRLGQTLLGAIVVTVLLTGAWWAVESGALRRLLNGGEQAESAAPAPAKAESAPASEVAAAPAPLQEAAPPTQAAPTPTTLRIRASEPENLFGYDLDGGGAIAFDPSNQGAFDVVDVALVRVARGRQEDVYALVVMQNAQFAAIAPTQAPARETCEAAPYTNEADAAREGGLAGRAYCVRTNQGRLFYLFVRSGPGPSETPGLDVELYPLG